MTADAAQLKKAGDDFIESCKITTSATFRGENEIVDEVR
jgi:hypothetical protein